MQNAERTTGSRARARPADAGAEVAATAARPAVWPAAGIAGIEAAGVAAYTAAIAVSAFDSHGSTVTAPVAEIAVFAIFALGIGAVAWFLGRRRHGARTPFVLVQVFGLVVAYTLLSGSGATVTVIGLIVLALAAAGLVVAVRPKFGDALD